jgi:hypothetical protein
MDQGKVFQIIDLGVFSTQRPKVEFRERPHPSGRSLMAAMLFSPDNEDNGEKAYANLRLTVNNKAQMVSSICFALQKDEEDQNNTPRYYYPMDCDIKTGQFLQGYVELQSPTRQVGIKLYLIYAR